MLLTTIALLILQVTCQHFIHKILLPHVDWLKASQDFNFSTKKMSDHFHDLAITLTAYVTAC